MTTPLNSAFAPEKLKQVDIYLNGSDTFIRNDGETVKLKPGTQAQFLALWNAVDGHSDMVTLFERTQGHFSHQRELIAFTADLMGVAFAGSEDSDKIPTSSDTGEVKLDSSAYAGDFDNIHLNLDISEDEKYKEIIILGGGTAGYFTALAFRNQRPDLNITLIESSDIPIIGVGEATTPVILPFIHHVLGISPAEFYEKVKPSWKLGIKFDWGKKDHPPFYNPFGINNLLETYGINQSLEDATLGTSLMMDGKGLFALSKKGVPQSLLDQVGYAYHLENKQLIAFLKDKLLESGVKWLDRRVTDVNLTERGEIESLQTNQNETFSADLFVDCTGFASILLEKTMGSAFISYGDSLFTDRAVTGKFSDQGAPDPYTLAQTMDHGWNWQIPVRGENHRGYVFSSDHCTEDAAQAEMQANNPEIKEFHTVKFRSGRHTEFWKKNVVGIGNAYGFVEPLESTGLHMIIESIQTLIQNLPVSKNNENNTLKRFLNEKIGSQWDYIKGFLAIHYKYNEQKDTEFWRRCRHETDVSQVQDLLDIYRDLGPLTAVEEQDPEILRPFVFDRIFGTHGFDYMLMGQGIPYGNQFKFKPEESRYPEKRAHWKAISQRALSNQEALQFAYSHADQLNGLVE